MFQATSGQLKPLLRSKTAELFVSPKALILLFRWIFWVCILGFSIALISNVARILIHKWTVEAGSWKSRQVFGHLLFQAVLRSVLTWRCPSFLCMSARYTTWTAWTTLWLSMCYLTLVAVLGSVPMPLSHHEHAMTWPVTGGEWRFMSHELPSPLHFCWPCWVARGHRAEQFFPVCYKATLDYPAPGLLDLPSACLLRIRLSWESANLPRQKWSKQQAWEKCCWNMVATITLSHCNCCLGFSVGGPEVMIIEDHKKTILAWLWLDA